MKNSLSLKHGTQPSGFVPWVFVPRAQIIDIRTRQSAQSLQQLTRRGEESCRPKRRVLRQCRCTVYVVQLSPSAQSVGDLDALRGIFSSRIASSAMTLQALDCEANADYSTAERIYRQVLVMLSICIHVHVAECPVLFASSFVLLNFLASFCPIFVLADHIRDDTIPVEKKTFILIPQSLV